ncbi:hypothetical protein HZA76_04225 [Candidatus Roizmanbacteria bacterium]|nr:hypothetical protein [Candidatus Roizmanbacteria bacterium]
MRSEFKPFVLNPYVTSSSIKQQLLTNVGYRFVNSGQLVSAVGNAEKKNPLIINDNDRQNPVVLEIARRKAEGLANQSRLIATFGGVYVPLVVNDTVWNFSFNHGQDKTRTIINKPENEEDVETLKQFYQDARGALVYSSAGLCVATPDTENPIPYSMLTKLRIGQWLGNVPEDYLPVPSFSLGIDIITALKQGYIDPHGEMKFELIFFDDTETAHIKGLKIPIRRQLNFEMRLPYFGTDDNLSIIKSLSSGIIPPEIFESEKLKLVKQKKYVFTQSRS